jgi:hypothetical protein
MPWLVRMASWIVPAEDRAAWRARWNSGLRNLAVLTDRGELPGSAAWRRALSYRAAFAHASAVRFGQGGLARRARGPAFLLAAAAIAIALLAFMSHGFSVTRAMIEAAYTLPAPGPPQRYDPVRERLFVHITWMALAVSVAAAMVSLGRFRLRSQDWRCWSFLFLKTLSVVVFVPLLWFEGGARLRGLIHAPNWRILLGGVGLGLFFVAVFAVAVMWCFIDQARRCPVCLRRLYWPVTMGSWSSVLDPVSTELLCDRGHGSLTIPEMDNAQPEQWIALDRSWSGLFEQKR